MTVSIVPIGDAAVCVRLEGEFDANNLEELEDAVEQAFAGDQPIVAVDLSGVTFLDSTMFRLLIIGRERATRLERELVLIRPDPMIWRVFTVAGLDKIFRSYASLDEVLSNPTAA